MQVRWGVLGCARVFERRMVPGFAIAENAELVGLASRTREKAQAACDRYGIPRAYGSYDALLADSEIEAVFIPLPNHLHREWTLRALEAGKHVLCDKPAALSAADAQLMADAARASGLRLMEGFMWRHHPQHARVREIIVSGELGDLIRVHSVFSYQAAPDPNNIRWQHEYGGGAILDVGVYTLNAARFLLDAEPVAATATALFDPNYNVDVRFSALLEFADGRTATVSGGFDQPFLSRYEVVGTKSSVIAERGFQVGEKGVNVLVREGDDYRSEFFPHVDQYGKELIHFSDCVRDAEKPLFPGEDGAAQAVLVEAVLRSAREQRRVLLEEVIA